MVLLLFSKTTKQKCSKIIIDSRGMKSLSEQPQCTLIDRISLTVKDTRANIKKKKKMKIWSLQLILFRDCLPLIIVTNKKQHKQINNNTVLFADTDFVKQRVYWFLIQV